VRGSVPLDVWNAQASQCLRGTNTSPAPRRLDGAYTLGRYWNYLRRQLYVMDTYACAAAARTNHTMLALHSYLSWAFVAPALLAGLRGATQAAALLQVSQLVSATSPSAMLVAACIIGQWHDRKLLHTLQSAATAACVLCEARPIGWLARNHTAEQGPDAEEFMLLPHGLTHLLYTLRTCRHVPGRAPCSGFKRVLRWCGRQGGEAPGSECVRADAALAILAAAFLSAHCSLVWMTGALVQTGSFTQLRRTVRALL